MSNIKKIEDKPLSYYLNYFNINPSATSELDAPTITLLLQAFRAYLIDNAINIDSDIEQLKQEFKALSDSTNASISDLNKQISDMLVLINNTQSALNDYNIENQEKFNEITETLNSMVDTLAFLQSQITNIGTQLDAVKLNYMTTNTIQSVDSLKTFKDGIVVGTYASSKNLVLRNWNDTNGLQLSKSTNNNNRINVRQEDNSPIGELAYTSDLPPTPPRQRVGKTYQLIANTPVSLFTIMSDFRSYISNNTITLFQQRLKVNFYASQIVAFNDDEGNTLQATYARYYGTNEDALGDAIPTRYVIPFSLGKIFQARQNGANGVVISFDYVVGTIMSAYTETAIQQMETLPSDITLNTTQDGYIYLWIDVDF